MGYIFFLHKQVIEKCLTFLIHFKYFDSKFFKYHLIEYNEHNHIVHIHFL